MHYFQFNIGDYASHTRHLSLLEDLAYRRLLDVYYLKDGALVGTAAEVARQIGMRDHIAEVEQVLQDFFIADNQGGWGHTRCDAEIAHFRDKSLKASNAGRASAQRRNNGRSTDAQPTNNQQPITNNQETNIPLKGKVLKPDGVSQQVWDDFMAVRKAKKSPMTETALRSLMKQASIAGWNLQDAISEATSRGWLTFKAEWVKEQRNGRQFDSAGASERAARQALHEISGGTGSFENCTGEISTGHATGNHHTIDAMPDAVRSIGYAGERTDSLV
jgi:uncharacterized protein YdaU (DUF1376 family)